MSDPYDWILGCCTFTQSLSDRTAVAVIASIEAVAAALETFECSHCNETLDTSLQSARTWDGAALCAPCFDAHYCILESSGDIAPLDDCVFLEGTHAPRRARSIGASFSIAEGWYNTEDCTTCTECDTYSHDSQMRSFRGDNNTLCMTCLDGGDFCYVDSASTYHRADDDNIYYWESDGEYHYDPEPEDNDDEDIGSGSERENIYEHDTNPLTILGRYGYVGSQRTSLTDCRAILLGVELEVDKRSSNEASIATQVIEATDWSTYGIVKSDATCSGGEYVSVPADLNAHKTLLAWDTYLAVLRPIAIGYGGADNGMHVHINRRALSPLTLGRMLVFLNNTDNRAFLTMIAQRKMSQATDWTKMEGKKRLADGGRRASADKYVILNVRAETAELRMFKSTLMLERLYKNLEFCEALVLWCRDAGAIGNLTTANFCQFVSRNRKPYQNLYRFMKARWQGSQTVLGNDAIFSDLDAASHAAMECGE